MSSQYWLLVSQVAPLQLVVVAPLVPLVPLVPLLPLLPLLPLEVGGGQSAAKLDALMMSSQLLPERQSTWPCVTEPLHTDDMQFEDACEALALQSVNFFSHALSHEAALTTVGLPLEEPVLVPFVDELQAATTAADAKTMKETTRNSVRIG